MITSHDAVRLQYALAVLEELEDVVSTIRLRELIRDEEWKGKTPKMSKSLQLRRQRFVWAQELLREIKENL